MGSSFFAFTQTDFYCKSTGLNGANGDSTHPVRDFAEVMRRLKARGRPLTTPTTITCQDALLDPILVEGLGVAPGGHLTIKSNGWGTPILSGTATVGTLPANPSIGAGQRPTLVDSSVASFAAHRGRLGKITNAPRAGYWFIVVNETVAHTCQISTCLDFANGAYFPTTGQVDLQVGDTYEIYTQPQQTLDTINVVQLYDFNTQAAPETCLIQDMELLSAGSFGGAGGTGSAIAFSRCKLPKINVRDLRNVLFGGCSLDYTILDQVESPVMIGGAMIGPNSFTYGTAIRWSMQRSGAGGGSLQSTPYFQNAQILVDGGSYLRGSTLAIFDTAYYSSIDIRPGCAAFWGISGSTGTLWGNNINTIAAGAQGATMYLRAGSRFTSLGNGGVWIPTHNVVNGGTQIITGGESSWLHAQAPFFDARHDAGCVIEAG